MKMKSLLKYFIFSLVFFYACKEDKKEKKVVGDLNSYSISSIVLDKLNTKWIGTDQGLFKRVANGYELQDISGKILSLFFEKSSNTLWVGTDGGLYKGSVSGENISISRIPSSNLSNNMVWSAYVDSSAKRWFGTDLGFTLNKGTVWKTDKFLYNDLGALNSMDIEQASINAIAIGNGNYFFATNSYGLYRAYGYDESVDAFSGATQWASPYNGESAVDSIFAVIIDSQGSLWFGGTNGVQRHLNGQDSKLYNDYFINELPNPRVHAIAEAPDGNIWAGTENGYAIFDGNSWTDQTNKLTDNKFVTSIAFDTDGSAFIGTKKGLYVIK
jgi:hypothetical protein